MQPPSRHFTEALRLLKAGMHLDAAGNVVMPWPGSYRELQSAPYRLVLIADSLRPYLREQVRASSSGA
jgi:hypothetical protein